MKKDLLSKDHASDTFPFATSAAFDVIALAASAGGLTALSIEKPEKTLSIKNVRVRTRGKKGT